MGLADIFIDACVWPGVESICHPDFRSIILSTAVVLSGFDNSQWLSKGPGQNAPITCLAHSLDQQLEPSRLHPNLSVVIMKH